MGNSEMSAIIVSFANPSGNGDKSLNWLGIAPVYIQDDAQKFTNAANEKIRNSIWASRDLDIFPDSELGYAVFPIAIAFFWDQWGSVGLSHCL